MTMDPASNESIASESAYPTPYATSPLLPLLLLSLASQKHSPTTKTTFKTEYDYIIVGAGSAGSVVANRLSELSCVSVLLLEAGNPPPRLSDIPGIARSFINTDIDWQYKTAPQRYTAAGLNDMRVPWPSGKTLGGSGALNAMLYVRGNRRNYDDWEKLGAKGWSYDDVLPYFKKLENNTDAEYVASGFHGTGGPITVERPKYNPEVKLSLMDGIRSLGINFTNVNGAEQIGFFDHQSTTRGGQRCSTSKAYLVPIEHRENVDIVTNAMVKQVLIRGESPEAYGVEFDFNGTTHQVSARKEVILSAGTTNSAQLLMLSGIGPMSELKKHKIPLVADLPVGLNLQEHPLTFLTYEVEDRLPKFSEELRKESNIQDYISNRTGPLTSTQGVSLISFLSNSDSDDIPHHTEYLVDFDATIFSQMGLTSELFEKTVLPLVNKTVVVCCSQLLHSHSIGSVSLESADPYDPPVIDPNFYSDFRDIEDVVQGLKKCQSIMNTTAMQRLGAKPVDILIPGCEEFANNEDLYFRCIVRTVVFAPNNQVGTAKMGDPTDPTTVVDPELRVKGVRRLRVVDASIMPTIPWSNTNIPTIMVAEKASDIIKKTIQCKED